MSKFWGLTVSAGKKFKQHVPEAFCVSGAAVEPAGGEGNPVQLYMQQDDNDYLLCSLSPTQAPFQTLLNVRIGSGETVGFHLKGGSPKSKVHLTGFTLQPGSVATPANPPFKGQQKSILVTQPKSDDKQKKRVSIMETEPYGEKEEVESSDDDDDEDDNALNDIRKKLFNGDLQESDDDDDDDDDDEEEDEEDENSDSDLNEEELKELQQFKLKGKYNPETGGKMDVDEDSDLELIENDSDEDEDDSEDDSDDQEKASKAASNSNNRDKKQLKQKGKKSNSSSPNTPNKQSDNKNKNNSVSGTPKTPENQGLKLKAPSSAGHTPMSAPMKTFNKGGVLVNELKVGNGQVAKLGKMVAVYYSGRLKSTNKQFDSNQHGQGFKFRLGKGEVIKGWDHGVEGMKVGGKRRLTIPASMAYGKKGAAPDIPPNATLVFEVELRNVS